MLVKQERVDIGDQINNKVTTTTTTTTSAYTHIRKIKHYAHKELIRWFPLHGAEATGFKQKTCLFFHDIIQEIQKPQKLPSEGNIKYAAKWLQPFVFPERVLLIHCFNHSSAAVRMITFFGFGYNDLINFQVLTFQAFSMTLWSNDPFHRLNFYSQTPTPNDSVQSWDDLLKIAGKKADRAFMMIDRLALGLLSLHILTFSSIHMLWWNSCHRKTLMLDNDRLTKNSIHSFAISS